MNIFGLANNIIQTINPNVIITWRVNNGYETLDDGSRVPAYIDNVVSAQVQSSSAETLKMAEGLNESGIMRSIWMYGNVQGVVVADAKGGDLLIFPQTSDRESQTWKVVTVVETWDKWAHVLAVLQDDY